MRYSPLSVVRHRLRVGEPLPFDVHDHDRTLLLARGIAIESAAQLDALLERGALVDLLELHRGGEGVGTAPPQLLGALWTDSARRLRRVLARADRHTLRAALDDAAEPVLALIQRDPDLAIVQVMWQEGNSHTQYGLDHAIHAAIACRLVAERLQWQLDDAQRAFKAALTMNLSIFELQGILASRRGRPDVDQQRQIQSHPARSRRLLELAGVTDRTWLDAVEQHHETPAGTGYPRGIDDPQELATLLHWADVFTTRLSPRAYRAALPADLAARGLFAQDPDNPIVAALVKEFGVYPPGCHVRLASGESGIVVRRGPTVMAATVAVLVDPHGAVLAEPLRRDTGNRAFAITGVLDPRTAEPQLVPEQLAGLLAA